MNHLKSVDPVMAEIIGRVGPLRWPEWEPSFYTLVRSIVYQQLSGKAAATIFGRLEAATPVTPEAIGKMRGPRLRALGLSAQKQGYLKDLARKTRDGKIVFAALAGMEDRAVIDTLTAVRGVGVWTAQMFLMFGLKRPDVFPAGDLGIQNAMRRFYRLPARPKPAEMEACAAPWRPWRTVASLYLWRGLDGAGNL